MMRSGEPANSSQRPSEAMVLKDRNAWLLFLVSLVVRLALAFGTGERLNYGTDSLRYVELSERVAAANFDFEVPEFIVSPGYPLFLGVIRIVSGGHWLQVMEIAQAVLSAVETVVLYRIAALLWTESRVAVLAALGHAFYPPNLTFVPQIGQESLFEVLWVACIYWLIRSARDGKYGSVCLSALFFGLGYLTKSHILLFAPFVCVHYLLNGASFTDSVKKIAVFGALSFALSIPWGIHNWRTKDTYILSSSGYGSHYLGCHNDDYYRFLFDMPPLGTVEWARLSTWSEYRVFQEINALRRQTGMSDKAFQKLCYETGKRWSRENPDKLYRIKTTDFFKLFRPGVSRIHYPYRTWLASFLVCTPVFVLAYAGIVRNLWTDFRSHFWILGIFLMMLVYIMSFYFQGRFRTITIEQFYLLYCAFMADLILSRLMGRKAVSAS